MARERDRTSSSTPAAPDVRCTCGSLLARWTTTGLELKCRRCKRTHYIPYPDHGDHRPRPPPGEDPPK